MGDTLIPHRLVRTIPKNTTDEVESYWDRAAEIHAGWELVSYRDPIDETWFPITSPHWDKCTSGAQLAGLVRLEALWHRGGVYIDSDVECFKAFTPLMGCKAFAAWEDPNTVPDAIIGAEAGHPAIRECLDLAIARLGPMNRNNLDWRTGPGAWSTGPGVTTAVFPGRGDVLLLPPGAMYEVHYNEKNLLTEYKPSPWTFASHKYAGSWLASL